MFKCHHLKNRLNAKNVKDIPLIPNKNSMNMIVNIIHSNDNTPFDNATEI